MIAENKRVYFLDRALTYLFSYDVKFDQDGEIGFVVGGVRVDLNGRHNGVGANRKQLAANPSLAYHAMGDRTVMDNDVVTGKVTWFADRLFVAKKTSLGHIDAKMMIHTDDDALIWSQYQGVVNLGSLGFKRLLSVDPDDVGKSFEARAFISPRFETESVKYSWLAARQCVGYGRLAVEKGRIATGTFDIYSAG